jgi:hypothetical protein
MQPGSSLFHGQDVVYHDLGEEMLQHAFEGKNRFLIHYIDDSVMVKYMDGSLKGFTLFKWFYFATQRTQGYAERRESLAKRHGEHHLPAVNIVNISANSITKLNCLGRDFV